MDRRPADLQHNGNLDVGDVLPWLKTKIHDLLFDKAICLLLIGQV